LSKKHNIYIFLIILLSLKIIKSFEIRMVFISVSLILTALLSSARIAKKTIDLLVILLIIIVIGVFRSFFANVKTYDFVKDVLYFSKPILLILLGYFASKSIDDWKLVLKTFLKISVFMALFHIIHTLLYTDFANFNVSYIRSINGLGNIIEVLSLAILIASLKHKEIAFFSKKTRRWYLVILLISFVLYFSRTMFVSLFIFVLSFLGYTRLNKKGIKYITIMVLAIVFFYTYLFSINLPRDSTGVNSFLYKMKIAPEEIFSPKLDLDNKAALWDHWRAYEAYSAIQGLEGKPSNIFFGKGFGALVDLKFISPLGEQGMRYIPILHNGYVLILFKTGIFGLILYSLFLFYLYAQSYKKNTNSVNKVIRNIISGIGLYLLFSTLIITGLYNIEEIIPFVLGVFLHIKSVSQNLINENRNIRN